MNKTLKWILIIAGLLLAVWIVMRVAKGSGSKATKVTAAAAERRTIIETVDAPGKIYPEVEVKVSPDVAGEITDLYVEEGDSVKRGQVLAKIYAQTYSSQRDEAQARVTQSQATAANGQAALEAQKAQLDQARQAYDRNKDLYDQKVISKAEFEQFSTSLRTAQSQYNAALQNIRSLQAGTQGARTTLQQAAQNLSRAVITAPMDGVVSSLSVKKGERVAGNNFNVGTEMMRVADMGVIEVRADVGENDIVRVHVGDPADVQVEAYNNRKFSGTVTKIVSSAKATSLAVSAGDVTNYEVHVRLDPVSYKDLLDPANPRQFPFRSGMNATAYIKTMKRENVVCVPNAGVTARVKDSDKNIEQEKKDKEKQKDESEEPVTVSSDELEAVVFVIGADSRVTKRRVTVGIQDIRYIEITSGLKEGEQIVTAPFSEVNKDLKSGTEVKVVPREAFFKE